MLESGFPAFESFHVVSGEPELVVLVSDVGVACAVVASAEAVDVRSVDIVGAVAGGVVLARAGALGVRRGVGRRRGRRSRCRNESRPAEESAEAVAVDMSGGTAPTVSLDRSRAGRSCRIAGRRRNATGRVLCHGHAGERIFFSDFAFDALESVGSTEQLSFTTGSWTVRATVECFFASGVGACRTT